MDCLCHQERMLSLYHYCVQAGGSWMGAHRSGMMVTAGLYLALAVYWALQAQLLI